LDYIIVRRLSLFLVSAAFFPAASSHADSQSFTLSAGYNETALTSELNRGTVFQAQIARGRQLFRGSMDSRGLASIGIGRIANIHDADTYTSRYPVLTVFGRAGEGSGIALDLHQDWFWRGTPSRAPGKHTTMFQTQGGIVLQDGEAPKVRVTHRFVSSQRRFPGRTQGVEWVWEFRKDYPAYYSRSADRGELTPMLRWSMRAENWAFFSREMGFGVARVNIGATYRHVPRTPTAEDPSASPMEQALRRPGTGTQRIPVLMVRLAYEFRRW
jgi:hypothetical protein